MRVGQVCATRPALTAIDLAERTGGDAIDQVLRTRSATLRDLWRALERTRYRVGNRARRRLLVESRSEPWSAAERLAHQVLRAAGIKGWRANVPVLGGAYYLDIAFEGEMLAIEIDGRRFHWDPVSFENDRERQNRVVLAGWTVLRFTYRMLLEQPELVVAAIRAARGRG